MNKTTTALPCSLLVIAGVIAASPVVRASYASDFIAPALSGVTATDGWYDLNNVNFPGYGTHGTALAAWPQDIGSNQAGSGDAGLGKIAGTSGYLTSAASNVLYVPGTPLGVFTVNDATPVAGLSTIVLQISSTGDLGANGASLDFNGGDQSVAPTSAVLLSSGSVTTAFGSASQYVWAYQWDLTTGGTINAFTITWAAPAQHTMVFGARLDQGSVYSSAIPEPASFAAVAGLGVLGLAATRRRRA